MFLLRDATPDDFSGIKELAESFNTVNLPNDDKELKLIIETATKSFSHRTKDPFEREFLFVMEDLDNGKVVGTSQIMAQHGTPEAPHIYFDVLNEDRYSETVGRVFHHQVLRIGFNFNGPTEIGGLVLDSSYRGHPQKLGKQLSFIRFMYIAMHRSDFRERLLAELLPPLGEGGRSALWESVGRRFTGLDYSEADLISKHNKEFIRNLFPGGNIYVSLLCDEAQEVIGKVGPATQGVRKMLESIGFRPVARIDPFDGGPHFEAPTNEVWPIQKTTSGRVRLVPHREIIDGTGESAEGLVAVEPAPRLKCGRFRALWCDFRLDNDGGLCVPQEVADILKIKNDDEIFVLPLARHVRM